MDAVARRRVLEAEGRRLLDVARADPAAPVSTCPGWVVRDLVGHVASVWGWLDGVVAAGDAGFTDRSALAPPPDDDVTRLEWAGEQLSALVDRFAATDPARPARVGPLRYDAGHFLRRAQHETLVHRVDAELATTGSSTAVDPLIALDGIDELLFVLVPAMAPEPPDGSLHLHRTDGDDEYMLAVVTNEHAKGDAALRGAAVDLWLVLWGRRDLDGMELFGDRAVAEQWAGLSP